MITRSGEPEARLYYEQGYWRHADIWQDFEARVASRPDKPALVCGEASVTFGELRDAAAALSARLAREGVAPGDVVGLCGRHSIEAVIALMACFHRGAVLALVPPMFSEQQLRTLMRPVQGPCPDRLRRRRRDREVPCGGRGGRAARDRRRARHTDAARRAGRLRAPGRRPRCDGRCPALLRDDIDAEGDRPLDEYRSLRERAGPRTVGARLRGLPAGDHRVRVRRRARVRLPAGCPLGSHRGAAPSLGRRRSRSPDRAPRLHLYAADADAWRRPSLLRGGGRAQPLEPSRARFGGHEPGAPDRDARPFRPAATRRLRAVGGPGQLRARTQTRRGRRSWRPTACRSTEPTCASSARTIARSRPAFKVRW